MDLRLNIREFIRLWNWGVSMILSHYSPRNHQLNFLYKVHSHCWEIKFRNHYINNKSKEVTPQFHGRIISHIRRRRSSTDISTDYRCFSGLQFHGCIWRRNKTSYYVPILLAHIALRELIYEKFL